LHSKKFGVRCAPFAAHGDFFRTKTTMNRTRIEPQYAMPTTPKRGADACGRRADFSRVAGTPVD